MHEARTGGIGFGSLLGIAFIVLKLAGDIHWSWLWVLAPFWIPFAIVIAIMIVSVLIAILIALVEIFK